MGRHVTTVVASVAGLLVVGGAAALLWARRRYTLITVEGSSMSPTLRDGDRVLVRRCSGDRVARGQVVIVDGRRLRWPNDGAGDNGDLPAGAAGGVVVRAGSGRPRVSQPGGAGVVRTPAGRQPCARSRGGCACEARRGAHGSGGRDSTERAPTAPDDHLPAPAVLPAGLPQQ